MYKHDAANDTLFPVNSNISKKRIKFGTADGKLMHTML